MASASGARPPSVVGEANRIRLIDHIAFPHSLGLLYSAFTYYCGFKVNSGEYKLMGLAPYGRPIYRDLILERLVDLKPDGSFWLNMDYFNYCQGLTMTNGGSTAFSAGRRGARVAAGAAAHGPGRQHPGRDRGGRAPDRPPRRERTGMKHLVLAGGVALNCVANGRLLREGDFDDLWIQPAAGDAGGAWGRPVRLAPAPEQPRRPEGGDAQQGSLLGPELLDRPGRAGPGPAGCPAGGSSKRPSSLTMSPECSPLERSSAGSRAGWSSAPGP